jgi:hypothetical protein
MRARTVILSVILVGISIFAALNWTAFTMPTPLHLVVVRVEAPLGAIMLAVTAAVTVLYILFLTWLETSALLEARRSARELQAQRQLAENAEVSRIAELRGVLENGLRELRTEAETASQDAIARIDRLEAELRAEIERAGNTLAAYIGELEDRLGRSRPEPS